MYVHTRTHTPHTYVSLYWSMGVNWVEVVVADVLFTWVSGELTNVQIHIVLKVPHDIMHPGLLIPGTHTHPHTHTHTHTHTHVSKQPCT